MPAFSWPTDPSQAVVAFELRHPDPEAGALLLWAVSCVDLISKVVQPRARREAAAVWPGRLLGPVAGGWSEG